MTTPTKKDLINTVCLWIMAFLVVIGCIVLIAIGRGEALATVVLIIAAVVVALFLS